MANHYDLTGKTAVVTGAAIDTDMIRDLGSEVVRQMSRTVQWVASASPARLPTWSRGCARRRADSTPGRYSTCPAAVHGIDRR